MSTSQASTRRGRWSELLLGGAAAGLGAPLLLGGLRRVLHLGRGGSPASMGWTAGMMGALVAGGLARRRLGSERATRASSIEEPRRETSSKLEAADCSSGTGPAGDMEDEVERLVDWRREARRRRLAALELRAATLSEPPGRESPRSAEQERERGPRRGPSGREQPWHEALASTTG